MIVSISRFNSLSGNCSVDWATRENTAIAGTHFLDASGTVEFGRAEELKDVIVTLLPFAEGVGDLSFSIDLLTSEDCDVEGRYETLVVIKDTKQGIRSKLSRA